MKKVTNEMSPVKMCTATTCGYNVDRSCRAKAITIGDAHNPECDTFFPSLAHNRETRRIAGVGACKVSDCQYNDDFECSAESIEVGVNGDQVKCLTYSKRLA